MDDLFRKAADGYFLAEEEDHWQEINARLARTVAIDMPPKPQPTALQGSRLLSLYLALAGTMGLVFGALPLSESIIQEVHRPASASPAIIERNGRQPAETTPLPNQQAIAAIALANREEGLHGLVKAAGQFGMPETHDKDLAGRYDARRPGLAKIYDYSASMSAQWEPQVIDVRLPPSAVHISPGKNEDQGQTAAAGKKDPREISPVRRSSYISLLTGLQFNQIKNQGFGDAGLNGGLNMGLNLTSRVALEAGLGLSYKRYFTSGAYFSMDKVAGSMPSGMKLIRMEGKSTVLELPVSLRYAFIRNKNSDLSAAFGFSSFLMMSEHNNYLTMLNGNEETVSGSYPDHTKYLLAALNVSAAYTFRLYKKISFRVEPYLQIPVRGIGVGSLPVSAAGLRMGFVIPGP